LTCAGCPFVARDDRNVRYAQPARGLEAQMSVNHFAVASGQTRNLETEFTNTAAHTLHCRIVPARVARVKNQFVDGPDLDFHEYFSCAAAFVLPVLRRQPWRPFSAGVNSDA
jgi:hypothetical protein